MTQGLIERLTVVEAPTWGASEARHPGGRLRLRRAWPRRSGLALEYLRPDGRTVAAQWRPSRDELHRVARSTAARGADSPPVVGGAADGEEVLLQPGGVDRRLVSLAALVRRPGARLLVHRPEQRAVVELPEGRSVTYAKVLPPARADEARSSLARARRLSDGRFIVPDAIADAASPDVMVTAALSGESLHDLLAEGRGREAGSVAGAALRGLHDASPEGLPEHSEADERALVSRWAERLARYDAPLARAIWARLPAVGRALATQPATGAVPLHRDLHDRQVLIEAEGSAGLLDLDTLARGEPALDLANLLVHIELRALQGICEDQAAADAARAVVEGYEPGDEVIRRLGSYADATRLRLVAVYAFRPPFRAVAPALLATIGRPPLGGPACAGARRPA